MTTEEALKVWDRALKLACDYIESDREFLPVGCVLYHDLADYFIHEARKELNKDD